MDEPALDPAFGPYTEDRLTRDVTLWQRAKGHRFSSDDTVTAFVAARAAPGARCVLDMGCGIGSVLLHLAWTLPEAVLEGVEAQAVSFAMVRANIARNDLGARVTVHHGDLRVKVPALGRRFELVTGTPPYFPPDAALDAEDAQRAYARIEYRGGIDAYAIAGESALVEDGTLVLCGDARTEGRLLDAARTVGLSLVARTTVIPREGRAPLFAVFTLRRRPAPLEAETLVLRDVAGALTEHAAMLKRFSGF